MTIDTIASSVAGAYLYHSFVIDPGDGLAAFEDRRISVM